MTPQSKKTLQLKMEAGMAESPEPDTLTEPPAEPQAAEADAPAADPTEQAEESPSPAYGRIEAATRSDIEKLMTAHPMGEALAELAYELARKVDVGLDDDRALAGIAKELRSTLAELARLGVDGDDDLDAELSAPVRDEKDPE